MNVNRAESSFPDSLTFFLEAASPDQIERVTLRYGTDGRSCQDRAARQLLDFEPARDVSLHWTWDLERSGALPPGARVWWQWEMVTAAGVVRQTTIQEFQIRDHRHNWQSLARQGITLQWYQGGTEFGARMLDIAVESLDRLVAEMGVRPAGDILILVYPDSAAVQSALIHAAEWTGGVAFPAYNSILIGVGPDEHEWARSVVPHELAHLVVGTRVFNCHGVLLPTWLSEELAVYAEGPIASEETSRVLRALGRGTLPRLDSLTAGFSGYSDRAALAYAQSGLVVSYLVDTWGPQGIDSLLSGMQAGSEPDAALLGAFGMDTDGLDSAWRDEMGFPVTPVAPDGEAAPGPAASPTGIPTLALMVVTPNSTPRPSATPVRELSPEASSTPLPPTVQKTPAGDSTALAELGGDGSLFPWPQVALAGAGFGLLVVVFLIARRWRS